MPGIPVTDFLSRGNLANLKDYELNELKNNQGKYKEVWFTGKPGIKKTEWSNDKKALNHGFDTETNLDGNKRGAGCYKVVIGDHVLYRYEILKYLSAGHFGKVVLAKDHAYKNTNVALKFLNNGTEYREDYMYKEAKVSFALNTAMSKVDHHFLEPVVEHDFFRNHIILTYNLLGDSINDLRTYHYDSKGKRAPLRTVSGEMFKKIAWDLLESLSVLKKMDVLHNDMKTDNMLQMAEGYKDDYPFTKIIDYGNSCLPKHLKYVSNGNLDDFKPSWFESDPHNTPMNCRASMILRYKTPEALLGNRCHTSCDMWCYGYILTRFITGKPLVDEQVESEQLAAVIAILGHPPDKLVKSTNSKNYLKKALAVKNKKTKKPWIPKSTTWAKLLSISPHEEARDPLFIDLVEKIMCWDPEERLTPFEAMAHPWFFEFATERFKKYGDL